MEEAKHENKPRQDGIRIKKDTLWKLISGIMGVLLIISLYYNFTNRATVTGGGVGIDKAADDAVSYINSYLLQPGIKADLVSKKEDKGLYNVKINIGGREYDSYVTKDGKLLFPSAVDMGVKPTAEPTPTEAEKIEVSADDDAIKGDKDAPVTLIEFSDFECPFCAKFFKETLPLIQKEYMQEGKVKLIYRDFPLSSHPNAQKAAEAAECAGEQDKYYEMHDKLFEQGVKGGVDSFKQYAKDLGLNTEKFNDCIDSGKMASEIQKDMSDGQSYGVSGTPAFFINGKFISGAQPFEAFKQAIDAELTK